MRKRQDVGLRGAELRAYIKREPDKAIRQVFKESMWDKPSEMAVSVFRNQRTAVRGCTGSSKTYWTARIVYMWLWAWAPKGRVFTLAPSGRQVTTNLWKEMRDAYAQGGGSARMGGRLFKTPRYELTETSYAQGFTTDDPSFVHGIHGDADLIVVDDAHALPQEKYDELENMFSGGNTHILLLYNPTEVSGETWECTHRHAGMYHNIQIPFSETPNGRSGRDLVPQMLLNSTVAQWRKKYGPNSNFCRIKVDAEYPEQGADTLIPVSWVELAMRRPRYGASAWRNIGVDVARFGDDDTVLTPMVGADVLEQKVRSGQDTQATADDAEADLKMQRGASTAWVDDNGVGGGVTDALRRRNCSVQPINSAEKPPEGLFHSDGRPAADVFADTHSFMLWLVREALDPQGTEPLSMHESEELMAQLTCFRYKLVNGGRIQVETTREVKKRLRRSPDNAISLALAVFGRCVGRDADALAKHVEAHRPDDVSEREETEPMAELVLDGSETMAGLGEFR